MSKQRIKIVQIIGTRPQYEKLIRFEADWVIDTGQHYSKSLTLDAKEVDEVYIWEGVRNTARLLTDKLEDVAPQLVIVYGDTYSTLAGALAAKRANIPLMHVEAAVPYDNSLEGKIRRKVDSLSKYLICPTHRAYIFAEALYGKDKSVYFTGDLLYDRFLRERETLLCKWDIHVMTIHRRENLPDLQLILNEASESVGKGVIWFYLHPHTAKYIRDNDIKVSKNIIMQDPSDHKDMIAALYQAKSVITDSGGLVREASWAGVPFKFIGNNPWPETEAFGKGNAEKEIRRVVDEILRR